MNIFLLSPGRTATVTFANAFKCIEGYTSSHESQVTLLGQQRITYPQNHFESDNRLTWFLPRLTEKYADEGILVIVKRDRLDIAKSYNRRWYKINIMRAYSQGILLRNLEGNNLDVCVDYVNNVYEQIDFAVPKWKTVIELDLESPYEGIKKLLKEIDKMEYFDQIIEFITTNTFNQNKNGLMFKLTNLNFNLKVLWADLKR